MLMVFLICIFEISLDNVGAKLANLSIALLTYINILSESRGSQIPEISEMTILEKVIWN